jgi:hypothetical protein
LKRIVAASALAGLLVAVGPAPAAATITFFNDLGPVGTYNSYGGQLVSGSGSIFGVHSPAAVFQSAFTGEVTQIDLALDDFLTSGPVTVTLLNGSFTPIASWTVSPVPFGQEATALATIDVTGISLVASQFYFLEATAGVNDAEAWNYSPTAGHVGFDVLGSTPEPATWALMLAGIAGVGGMLRRRAWPQRA